MKNHIMMKKFFVFPVMAVLLITGCDKEIAGNSADETVDNPAIENPESKPIVFTSFASEDGTKVEIDGYDLKFSVGEKIAVASFNFASETEPIISDYAEFQGEEASASGTFVPAEHKDAAEWTEGASAVSFYSYYPTSGAPDIPETTATVSNISATQDGTINNIVCWAKGSHVATAEEVIDGKVPSFNFSPVCALVKLTIKNEEEITASLNVELTATSDGNIAGPASLNLLTGVLSGGESKNITYNSGESPIVLESDGEIDIYLSFIPGVISNWNLSVTDSRDNYVISTYSLNKEWPTTLLPGRMYAREFTITHITGVTGSLGTYAGIPFVRGFLKRNSTETTTDTDMSISDATVNPLELLTYMNMHGDNFTSWKDDVQCMYFDWNGLRKIFTGSSDLASFETSTITYNDKNYSVASKSNLEELVSTNRSSQPTINGVNKAWSVINVSLTDSQAALGTDYSDKGFVGNDSNSDKVKGILFFPDGGTVICEDINAQKCDSVSGDNFDDPNTINCSQLKVLVKGGCLFLPMSGGQNGSAWTNRGAWGYVWSSTVYKNEKGDDGRGILRISKGTSDFGTYAGGRHFPVLLVEANE